MLYARSNRPAPAHLVTSELKNRIDKFSAELWRLFRKRRSPSNLLPHQRECLTELRNNPELAICKTDKNLGPAIIERKRYLDLAFRDHLSDQHTYQQITKAEAIQRMTATYKAILAWLNHHKDRLSKAEITFLKRTCILHDDTGNIKFPQFYLLAKIHKTPLKTRPIVSVIASLLHGLGRWVDRQLQPIARSIPSFVNSSFALTQKIRTQQDTSPFPPTALLFTCDAVSMYTNIDTNHAIGQISSYVPGHVTYALQLIMENNVFQFSDTYWHQLSGTAMGTPPACMYATLYLAAHEAQLRERFGHYLLHWSRYIDDGFGVWNWTDTPDCHWNFNQFCQALNYGKLTWEVSKPTRTVNFLDLTLSIDNGKIDYTLYEKSLNLYLYIPPASAHPPGVLKGLIAGSLLRILRLTSNPDVRKKHMSNFYARLIARGYTKSILTPIFDKYLRQYHQSVTPAPTTAPRPDNSREQVYLHLPYHPLDPPSTEIQALFRKHLLQENPHNPYASTPLYKLNNGRGKPLGIRRLIVAYHRPPTLGTF